jgi:hypothetical protein
MIAMRIVLIAVLALATGVFSTALDDYVNAPDAHYKWVDLVRFRSELA